MLSSPIHTVTVYAASSSQVDITYVEAARLLGKMLAEQDITCVNGAGNKGLMATLTDAVLEQGGRVLGIIPQFMVDEGWFHRRLTEMIVTPDMHTRKQLMAEKADACIALPGGIGTLEELLEIITWKQLGLFQHPIIIFNVNGFYNPLLEMLQRIADQRFMHRKHAAIWEVAETIDEILLILQKNPEWEKDPLSFAAL